MKIVIPTPPHCTPVITDRSGKQVTFNQISHYPLRLDNTNRNMRNQTEPILHNLKNLKRGNCV